MPRWGRCDYRELRRLKEKIDKLAQADYDKISEEAVKELAARMLAKVKRNTPVKEGTLRNGWDVTQVVKRGDVYEIEVINPVIYAAFVEYGHRQTPGRYVPAIGKRLKAGWVSGKFMMTISAKQIDDAAPAIVEKILMKHLKEVFRGD